MEPFCDSVVVGLEEQLCKMKKSMYLIVRLQSLKLYA